MFFILSVKSGFSKLLKFFLYGLLAVVILSSNVNAQIDPVALSKILAKANAEITTKTSSIIGEGDYILSGDSLFVNPDGTHYLYSYHSRRNTFIRQDHSTFHGHNFTRTLFLYNQEVYAFGGYGFWASHSKLIKFDKITKEWELVMIQNLDLNHFQPMHSAKIGDSIFVCGTYEHHATQKSLQTTLRSFIINLRDFKCKEYQNPQVHFIEKSSSASYNHQQSNYVIWGGPNTIDYILDKANGTYYKNASGPSFYAPTNDRKINFQDSTYRFVIGNELITVNPDYTIEKLDLQNYIKLFCLPENNINDWNEMTSSAKEQSIFIYQMIIAVLIVVFVVFLFIYFKTIANIKQSNYTEHNGIDSNASVIYTLLSIGNGEYSEKEIDMILRISHFPYSARKIKRSQMIYAINEQHPSLIEKIKNVNGNDFLYLIHSEIH